jgi:hypothetical protein
MGLYMPANSGAKRGDTCKERPRQKQSSASKDQVRANEGWVCMACRLVPGWNVACMHVSFAYWYREQIRVRQRVGVMWRTERALKESTLTNLSGGVGRMHERQAEEGVFTRNPRRTRSVKQD